VTPPHVALSDLRAAAGLTLDAVCERLEEATGITLTRGALSAIESGTRGASAPILAGLSIAYGLRPTAITTNYAPRAREVA
jgi:transcriptional regulator with XRE-family HTH domain